MGLTFSLVLALAGHAYVIDHGLTAEDCKAARIDPPAQVMLTTTEGQPMEALDIRSALTCQPE